MEGVLGTNIAWIFIFYLTVGFFLLFGFFEGSKLILGKNYSLPFEPPLLPGPLSEQIVSDVQNGGTLSRIRVYFVIVLDFMFRGNCHSTIMGRYNPAELLILVVATSTSNPTTAALIFGSANSSRQLVRARQVV